MAKSRRKAKKAIQEAADRAARRSAGIEETEPRVPIDPPIDPPKKRAKKTSPVIGRPTEYKPTYCDIAAETCARGGTIAELADRLGVARWTIYRWMTEHQSFGDAIRIAREIADERVGFSLYERAVGYSFDSVKIFQNDGEPVIVPYREHVPPDVTAGKFWLTNRQPDKWQDITRRELTGKGGEPLDTVADDREIARRVAFMLGRAVGRQEAAQAQTQAQKLIATDAVP